MIAVDTNILVYAFDRENPKKHKSCSKFVKEVLEGKRQACITTQILAELANVLKKKQVDAKKTRKIIEAFAESPHWTVYSYDEKTISAAIFTGSHFWDSLITETLLQNGVSEILTENIKHFPKLKARSPLQ